MDEQFKDYTILFIEDEKKIRDNYVKYLKRYFFEVYEAIDGEDGLNKYKKYKPDIIIVDINLPKLNGLELVEKINKINLNVKTIMLTAYFDTKYLLQAAELKLVKYLVKPITRNELHEALSLAIKELLVFDVVSKKLIQLDDGYEWNNEKQEMFCYSKEVLFTVKEKKIVALLFSKPNTVFSYEDIINNIWSDYENNKIQALKTLIKNIRKKLPYDTIKNIFSVGYKI